MDRRKMLESTLGVVTAGSASALLGAALKPLTVKTQDLIDYALACVKTGELCIQACLMRQGLTSTESIQACRDCVAVCETLAKLAASQSIFLKPYAALCAKVCRSCAEACLAEGSDDEACAECVKACEACAAACETIGS